MHHPDCEHCNAGQTCGEQMRNRLEELGWQTQPHSLDNGEHGVEVLDSNPSEGETNLPIPVRAKQKKVA